MKIDCIDEKTKEVILNEIFVSEYKEVMRYDLAGKSHMEIADIVGYSKRQVERITRLCWRNVCLRLAEQKAKKILNFYVAIRNESE